MSTLWWPHTTGTIPTTLLHYVTYVIDYDKRLMTNEKGKIRRISAVLYFGNFGREPVTEKKSHESSYLTVT